MLSSTQMSSQLLPTLVCAALLPAAFAGATDYPVAGRRIAARASAADRVSGVGRLVFVLNGPSISLPAGAADPITSADGDALVEIVSSGSAVVGAFRIPKGAIGADGSGWTLSAGTSLSYTNRRAPAGRSAVKTVSLRSGSRLKVVARRTGLGLAATEGTVGVRVTFGQGTPDEVRLCAQFGPTGTIKDQAGVFIAVQASATALTDCSDASLGTQPSLHDAIALDTSGCGPTYNGLGGSTVPGSDLHRVTLHGALEVCNDGSPAVFYIRQASDPAHANDWIVWLEGGGDCRSAADCADRWCGIHEQATYGAAKMSSRWTPLAIQANGIFRQDGSSNFEGYNQVVATYCSSDTWVGRNALDIEPGPTHPGYRLQFNGPRIFLGVLQAISGPGMITADDGTAVGPVAAGARILFGGTSGGGVGSTQHADRAKAWFDRLGVTSFHYFVDAATSPMTDDATLDDAVILEGIGTKVAFRNDLLEDSCVTNHSDTRYCGDPAHVLLHHVDQTYFLHQDLRDPVWNRIVFNDLAALETATRTLLEDQFLLRPSLPLDEPEIATHPAPTVFAPKCDHHVGLTSDAFFDNELGMGEDFHTNLREWFEGLAPVSLIDGVDGAATTDCIGWP
jgi:Pectinacetylesterase